MNWLRTAPLLALVAPALLFQACSSDDGGNGGGTIAVDYDASPLPTSKVEAGAPCHSATDCASGLDCLYPASTCEAFQVCATPIPDSCPGAQTVCSCLGLTTQVCNGFATQPTDSTLASGGCGDGGVVVIPDSGPGDSAVPDSSPAPDAGAGASDGATG